MNVKRTIVTTLLLLTMAGAASAAAPSWYWLCGDATSTTYLDNNHVYKNDDCAIVWTQAHIIGIKRYQARRISRNSII